MLDDGSTSTLLQLVSGSNIGVSNKEGGVSGRASLCHASEAVALVFANNECIHIICQNVESFDAEDVEELTGGCEVCTK